MSYSAKATALDGTIADWVPQPQTDWGVTESEADLTTGLDVAELLAAALGGQCTVSISGHSNPGRDGDGKYGPDFITVTVTRASTNVASTSKAPPAKTVSETKADKK